MHLGLASDLGKKEQHHMGMPSEPHYGGYVLGLAAGDHYKSIN